MLGLIRDLFALSVQQLTTTDTERRAGLSAIAETVVLKHLQRRSLQKVKVIYRM